MQNSVENIHNRQIEMVSHVVWSFEQMIFSQLQQQIDKFLTWIRISSDLANAKILVSNILLWSIMTRVTVIPQVSCKFRILPSNFLLQWLHVTVTIPSWFVYLLNPDQTTNAHFCRLAPFSWGIRRYIHVFKFRGHWITTITCDI